MTTQSRQATRASAPEALFVMLMAVLAKSTTYRMRVWYQQCLLLLDFAKVSVGRASRRATRSTL